MIDGGNTFLKIGKMPIGRHNLACSACAASLVSAVL